MALQKVCHMQSTKRHSYHKHADTIQYGRTYTRKSLYIYEIRNVAPITAYYITTFFTTLKVTVFWNILA